MIIVSVPLCSGAGVRLHIVILVATQAPDSHNHPLPCGAAMPITLEDVEKTALLARLELGADEKERLVEQLSSILDQIAVIAEVDTSAIPPTAQVVALHNVMRPDVVRPSLLPEQVLANAPDREDDFFKVRAVLE
jgi:aspartyl-tRNA(Asn)/glutamyl-tRNA(Gln) amidotransferase subunit C